MDFNQKKKVLNIIVGGKGVNINEKIVSIDSLNIKPKNCIFFTKNHFYSTLKETVVNEEGYNNSKLLYTLLKMRGMSYLNDLCNAQNMILLFEIIQSTFQTMFKKLVCNPKKCNLASKLSGCIHRENSPKQF